jgi:CRP-like cAMP-binding protein
MNRLEKLSANPNQVIFRKGDPSAYFYIIIKGKVEISEWAEGEGTKTIARGDCFGDMGIYNKASRSATATAVTKVEVLGLKKENFLRVSLELSKRAQREVFQEIKNIPIFKNLSLHQKHKIAYLAQQLRFQAGATIFKKG